MYNPLSACSAVLHLLIKHPILVVGLGLAGAVAAVNDAPESVSPPKDPVAYESAIVGSPIVDEAMSISAEKAKQVSAIAEDLQSRTEISAQSRSDGGIEVPVAEVNESVKRVTEKWFAAIRQAESNNQPLGVHPDGVSFGPAGLTEIALRDVMPDCRTLGYDEVLNDPEASSKFAYLYFLDLIHEFGDVEVAVIAYNSGKTRVKKWQKEKRPLPGEYLARVKAHLK